MLLPICYICLLYRCLRRNGPLALCRRKARRKERAPKSLKLFDFVQKLRSREKEMLSSDLKLPKHVCLICLCIAFTFFYKVHESWNQMNKKWSNETKITMRKIGWQIAEEPFELPTQRTCLSRKVLHLHFMGFWNTK